MRGIYSYTLCQGRHEEALELLRTIYSTNTRDSGAHYKVASLGREDCCTGPQQSQGLGQVVQKVRHFHKCTSLDNFWLYHNKALCRYSDLCGSC